MDFQFVISCWQLSALEKCGYVLVSDENFVYGGKVNLNLSSSKGHDTWTRLLQNKNLLPTIFQKKRHDKIDL